MTGLYSLRRADPSVRLAVVLFQLVLGYAYLFAFLMVRQWAGLTPTDVRATYVPAPAVEAANLEAQSLSRTQPLDLGTLTEERHTVDTKLLIQDSHIHILMFCLVAAFETIIILGLGWPAWGRNTAIVAAFAAGALDFSGQWLMHFRLGGFALLTIAAGWLMTAVYVVVLLGTLRAVVATRSPHPRET
jgi:hypothetical protein